MRACCLVGPKLGVLFMGVLIITSHMKDFRCPRRWRHSWQLSASTRLRLLENTIHASLGSNMPHACFPRGCVFHNVVLRN